MTEKQTEALEKLNRGIQESRQEVQQRTMSLAQDYFGDSAEELKQQIKESRATLEGLPDQVPGGREEAFHTMFQELMDNYSAMEECINEARRNVANLDTDQIRRQGEVEATDAARRDARELGIDLTEIEGTGSDGRVTVDDVKNAAETMEDGAAGGAAQQAKDTAGQAAGQAQQAAGQAGQVAGQAQDAAGQAAGQAQQVAGQTADQAGQVAQGAQDALGQATGQVGQIADQGGGATEEINATDAAKREAEERGIDLSKVKGTGADGRIVIWDVTESTAAAEGGTAPAGQLQNQASDAAGGAAQQAQQAAGQATDQAQQVAGQATDQAGQVAGQAQEAVGGLTGGGEEDGQGGGGPLGGVTDQVGQVAGQAQDVAGQAAGQAQQAAGQATGQAGRTADQAKQGNAAQESGEEPKITKAAKRKAEEMGTDLSKIQGSGAGGLITIKDVVGA